MKGFQRYPYVLAIYPNTRGFSFALFESALSIVDWGVKEVRGLQKNNRCLIKVEAIITRYVPSVLVIQDMTTEGTRRTRRIRALNTAIAECAAVSGVRIVACSRGDVLKGFREFGVSNKHDVAEVIARHVPALARYVPPPRRPWMSEDARMGLFDAAALALTYFKAAGEMI